MKKTLAILFVIISLFASAIFIYFEFEICQDKRPIFDPFEINYNVTERGLLDEGYTMIPEDVPLLGKRIGDTLIYYQLDYECDPVTHECKNKDVNWRRCEIYFDKVDSVILEKVVSRYDAEIISGFSKFREVDHYLTDSTYSSEGSFGGAFFVQHRYTNEIFECHIGPTDSISNARRKRFTLSISTHFPMGKEQIEWDKKMKLY